MYFLAALLLVCVDVMVMSFAQDITGAVLWIVVSLRLQCTILIVWVRVRRPGNASFKLMVYGCVVYLCCVGFASLDVVCDELYDCAWNVGL